MHINVTTRWNRFVEMLYMMDNLDHIIMIVKRGMSIKSNGSLR